MERPFSQTLEARRLDLHALFRAAVHAVRRPSAGCVEVTLLAEEPPGGLAASGGESVQVEVIVQTLTPVQLLLEPLPPSVPGPGPE